MREGSTVVLSCKVPQSIGMIIDRVRREHPEAFPDKSSIIRAAVLRLLRDIGYLGANSCGIPAVDSEREVEPIDELVNSISEEDEQK